jgi:hypothetical protein
MIFFRNKDKAARAAMAIFSIVILGNFLNQITFT